jgi:hypothetical protein
LYIACFHIQVSILGRYNTIHQHACHTPTQLLEKSLLGGRLLLLNLALNLVHTGNPEVQTG